MIVSIGVLSMRTLKNYTAKQVVPPSVKDGVIEIQGDYRERVGEFLRKDGWEMK